MRTRKAVRTGLWRATLHDFCYRRFHRIINARVHAREHEFIPNRLIRPIHPINLP